MFKKLHILTVLTLAVLLTYNMVHSAAEREPINSSCIEKFLTTPIRAFYTFKQYRENIQLFKALTAGSINTRNLIDLGNQIHNFKSPDRKRTPLHAAAESGNLENVMYLALLLNVNEKDRDKKTPLHYAAQAGHSHIVEYLLNHQNINFRSVDVNEKTASELAQIAQKSDVLRTVQQFRLLAYAKNDEETCPVCFDDDKNKNYTITDYKCLQPICTECKVSTRVYGYNCPVCRTPLSPENEFAYNPLTLLAEASTNSAEASTNSDDIYYNINHQSFSDTTDVDIHCDAEHQLFDFSSGTLAEDSDFDDWPSEESF